MIMCSACFDTFDNGIEYRKHFEDIHLKEFIEDGEDPRNINHKLNNLTMEKQPKCCTCGDYEDWGFCNCNDKQINTNSCDVNDPTCEGCDG